MISKIKFFTTKEIQNKFQIYVSFSYTRYKQTLLYQLKCEQQYKKNYSKLNYILDLRLDHSFQSVFALF